MSNAIKCDVPHRFIRETMTGKSERPENQGMNAEKMILLVLFFVL